MPPILKCDLMSPNVSQGSRFLKYLFKDPLKDSLKDPLKDILLGIPLYIYPTPTLYQKKNYLDTPSLTY